MCHSVEKLNGQGTHCEYLVKIKPISVPGYSLCCCRFAFAQLKHLLLSLRFRTVKTFVAVASLSHRAKLPVGERRAASCTGLWQRLRDQPRVGLSFSSVSLSSDPKSLNFLRNLSKLNWTFSVEFYFYPFMIVIVDIVC